MSLRSSLFVVLLPLALACGGSKTEEAPAAPPVKTEAPPAEPPAAPAAPPAPPAPAFTGAGTEADPFVATCDARARFEGAVVGQSYHVKCPTGCSSGSVWGTGTYTEDSAVCAAAIHAGALPAEGGLVIAKVSAGQDAYKGSEAHGITSRDWGKWTTTISFESPAAPDAKTAPKGDGRPVKKLPEARKPGPRKP